MASSNDDHIRLPRWFLATATTLATIVAGCAVGTASWAYSISTAVAVISTKLDAAIATSAAEVRHVSDRVTRHDGEIDRLDERLRTLEKAKP